MKSIDHEKNEIHFAAPHRYGIGGASKGLYFSINVLETLDQPGEYVYDRKAGKIYLLPPDGGRCLTFSLLNAPLFKIEKASGITIRGLTMESGLGVAALESNDCTEVVIEDCLLRNFAQDGVVIKGGSKRGVRHTELTRVGKGGVILDGGDRLTLTPGGHFVTDCEVHHYARILRTYQAAVSLSGVGHLVAYNYIHHAPHNAIGFGGNDHVIEYNRIEQVLLDTEDAGAIYTGRKWTVHGNIIRKNWFTRLGEGDHHGNFAFYADDQASGITAAIT